VVTGLTGGGKSTICRWLAERGAFILDADRVGHEILLREEIAAAVADAFGREILDEEGAVDRRRLGPLVFADPAALERLDRIVHPPLVAELQRRIDALRRSRACEFIVVDAALHYRFEPRLEARAVLWCEADEDEQIRRVMARDGLDEAAARARLERQSALRKHREQADRILATDAEPGVVRREVIAIVDELLGTELAASDPPQDLRAPDPAQR
jgi:dephospho-CoA kinase